MRGIGAKKQGLEVDHAARKAPSSKCPVKLDDDEAQALLVGLADEMDVAHVARPRGKQWKQSVLGLGTVTFMTTKLALQT